MTGSSFTDSGVTMVDVTSGNALTGYSSFSRHFVAWRRDECFLAFLPGEPSRSWWSVLAEAKREAAR